MCTRKFLLATAALLAFAGSACAADMALPAKGPAYLPAGAPGAWTGFYVGGNVGLGNNDATVTLGSNSVSQSDTNFLGGIQVGVNYQIGPHWLVGIETDYQLTNFKQSNFGGPRGVDVSQPGFGTARLRTGVVNGSWLFYGTGGAAYGHEDVSVVNLTIPTLGWAIGAGAEWRALDHFTLGAEYLHTDMKGVSGAGITVPEVTSDIFRVKFNVLFN